MNKLSAFFSAAIATGCLVWASPARANLSPAEVADGVYRGIQQLHGYQGTPRLVMNMGDRQRSACGVTRSTHYCARNHTVYITQQDIRAAYQHGDAALAYIIAHEYAHAMQIAYRFMPQNRTAAELQADCLAGAYLATLPNMTLDERDLHEIMTFAYRIGDYARWSQQHHGTPRQRVKAVLTGLQAATKGKGITSCRL